LCKNLSQGKTGSKVCIEFELADEPVSRASIGHNSDALMKDRFFKYAGPAQ